MERKFRAIFGDWSDDGHGKKEVVDFLFKGDDLSDEALQASLLKTNEEMGVNLFELCSEYEESSIPLEVYEKAVELGFSISDEPMFNGELTVYVEGGLTEVVDGKEVDVYFSAEELALWWIGRNISNFEGSVINDNMPILFGGYNPVLKGQSWNPSTSFGYGLFF